MRVCAPVREGIHRGSTPSAARPPTRRARGGPAGRARGPTSWTPACCWPTRARCGRFDEHEVVLPVVVITELEGKRHHPELGYFARAALRLLDELRVAARTAGPAGADRGERRHAARRAQPHRPDLAALGLPARRQRLPDPGRGPQPRRARAARSRWSPRTCRCASRPPRSGSTPRSTSPSWPPSPAGPGMAEVEVASAELDELYDDGVLDHRRRRRPALPHRARCCSPSGAAPWVASGPTSRCSWSGATGTPSGCTAAPRSSGSPWSCCWTPRSGSSRWAAAPAPASRPWRCAPVSRR